MAAEVGKVVYNLMNSEAKAGISRRAGRDETTAELNGSRCKFPRPDRMIQVLRNICIQLEYCRSFLLVAPLTP